MLSQILDDIGGMQGDKALAPALGLIDDRIFIEMAHSSVVWLSFFFESKLGSYRLATVATPNKKATIDERLGARNSGSRLRYGWVNGQHGRIILGSG